MHRFGHCVNGLGPVKDSSFNETDYLTHQIRTFLDQGNYDNEHLNNVTVLMDDICLADRPESSYPISVHLDVNKYNGTTGKEHRCRAIDEAMDSMYYVFKRAALNKSEPLDFSVIKFYPNATDRSAYYNLTDLINTSWIKSDTILENICKITDSVKDYVRSRSSNSSAQKRSEPSSALSSVLDFLDRLLDPILGLQKRIYLESTNRFEQMQTRISSGLGTIRDGLGRGVKSTRGMVSNLFTSSSNVTRSAVNSTMAVNSTFVVPAVNTTASKSFNETTVASNKPTVVAK